MQKTLGRLSHAGSKRPVAPSPNHFWRFSLFGQFPRSVASQRSTGKCRPIILAKFAVRSCGGPFFSLGDGCRLPSFLPFPLTFPTPPLAISFLKSPSFWSLHTALSCLGGEKASNLEGLEFFSEVIQEPLPLKLGISVKNRSF